MNKRNYRFLVFVSMAIPILAEVIERTWMPGLLPSGLRDAYQRYTEEEQDLEITLALVSGGLVVAVATLASLYGLLRFRPWAPGFALWSSVAMCVLLAFFGPMLMSGLSHAAGALGGMLWGAAIVLPFSSPELRTAFWPDRGAMGQQ